MINRELQKFMLGYYTKDARGFVGNKVDVGDYKYIDIMIKPYKNDNVEDVRYKDVEYIGLTKDSIDDNYTAICDGVRGYGRSEVYRILFTIPSSRYTQVFMKKDNKAVFD